MGNSPWKSSKSSDEPINRPDLFGEREERGSFVADSRLDEIRARHNKAYERIHADMTRRQHQQTPRYMRLLVFLVGIAFILLGLAIVFPATGSVDPYMIRGIVILTVFGGAAVFWSRSSLYRLAKIASLWLVIVGAGGFYLYQSDFGTRFMLATDPSGGVTEAGEMIISRARDGHFWVPVRMNGVSIRAMVDTGASNVVLSPDDAKIVGIDIDRLNYSGRAETANGSVRFARTRVNRLEMGDQVFQDVPITVNGTDMRGSLLGLSVLNNYTSIEMRGNTLILRP